MLRFTSASLEPTLLHSWPDEGGLGFATSDKIWATYDSSTIGVGEYGGDDWHVISQGLSQQSFTVAWDKTLFWYNGDTLTGEELAWQKSLGVYPFISYGNDPSQAVYGFGTDGENMAWVHSSGKGNCFYDPTTCPYTTQDIMVAPYTADPAQLQARRLRSFPTQSLAVSHMAVGCGYVGYGYAPGHTLIVRAVDGYWWELPSSGCTPPNFTGDWCFEDVFKLTCDEAFVSGGAGEANITRVAYSALGAMQPPD